MSANLNSRSKIIYLLLAVALSGCSPRSDGFAPGMTLPSAATDENNFKYGEMITTSNGWEASLDTTDPTEEIVLANGWSLEVKHE